MLARNFIYKTCNEEGDDDGIHIYLTDPPNWKPTCKNLLHQMGVLLMLSVMGMDMADIYSWQLKVSSDVQNVL